MSKDISGSNFQKTIVSFRGYVSFREGGSFGSSCLTTVIAESLRFLQMAYGVPELDRS